MKNLTITKIFGLALVTLFTACNKDDDAAPASTENPTGDIEVFAELDQAVGNIAYTDTGELVWSFHPFFKPDIRVVKYNKAANTTEPFPNLEWNTVQTGNENYLDDVLGVRNDSEGIVWMLDIGTRNNITPKLVGWNTRTNSLERVYPIPAPATIPTSQPQDLVIDRTHNVFVIADEDIARGGDGSKGALIVMDMVSGNARRVLEGHVSTTPDMNSPTQVEGESILSADPSGAPLLIGADGITLDKNNNWLYYAPLNGTKVYRLKMEDLVNTSLTNTELGNKVEVYSDKENNGGISIDVNNNLYLTNVETRGVGFVNAENQKLSEYATDNNMLWPDGVSYNKDGYMYIGASQVYLGDVFNGGEDKTTQPFYIFRYKPVVEGIFGR